MKKVIVASKNPVKINAARLAFDSVLPEEQFEFEGSSFPSGVPDQPMNDNETLTGAINRAKNAQKGIVDADFWVGMEGGLEEKNGVMEVFAWIVVLSKDKSGQSRTATFELPEKVSELIRGGMELAHADDQIFGRKNSGYENGSVGLMTRDIITRTGYYQYAAVLALIPFRNPDYY